jgi:hypothetical protein
VYNPRTKALTSLEQIPEAVSKTIEEDFLGDRSVIEQREGVLSQFVQGYLKKGTL